MRVEVCLKRRRTLVKIVPEGKKHGLTIPVEQARGLVKAEIPFDFREFRVGGIVLKPQGEKILLQFRNKRPLKLTRMELAELKNELEKGFYQWIPLRLLFEKSHMRSIKQMPGGLRNSKLILPKLDFAGWELNTRILPLTLSKGSAHINIVAQPSTPTTEAEYHLTPLEDEDSRKRIATPTYAKRVQRTRNTRKSRRKVAVKVHPRLVIILIAIAPPRRGKEVAVVQDVLGRELELVV